MSKLKVGDKVFIGPFEILQFRDTNRPGPQDTGDSIIVTRGNHGALSADTSLTIPAIDNLAAVARVMAAHPDGFMALGRVVSNIESDQKGESEGVWDYNDAELGFLRALAAALNGGTE